MAPSNEGNEGNEGNAGSLGSAAGGGFGVLPDRLDLPFIAEPGVAGARIGGTVWRPEGWDPAWAAWMVLTDFAQAVPLSHGGADRPRRLAWVTDEPGQAHGTIALDPEMPLMPDARIGDEYRLVYRTPANGEHGFMLTSPDGRNLGTYGFAPGAAQGARLSITNEVNLVITLGGTVFSDGQKFRIATESVLCRVVPRLQGNASAKGSCVLDRASPLLVDVQFGRYTLRCVDRNNNTTTFRLLDPSHAVVISSIVLPHPQTDPFPIEKQVKLALHPGTDRYVVGDAFDIDIQRAPWVDPPGAFQAPPIDPIPRQTVAGKGTLDIGEKLPAAFGASCNIGLGSPGSYSVECTDAPVNNVHAGIFKVTDPQGRHLGMIRVPDGPGKSGELVNQLRFVLRAGASPFAPADSVAFSITRTGMNAATIRGTTGNGFLTLRPWPMSAPAGRYLITCVQTAQNGGIFTVTGLGHSVRFPTTNPGGTVSVRQPFPFDLTDGTTDFVTNDGFAVAIADEALAAGDEAELLALVKLAEDERADALGEILAQSESFIAYFMAALGISVRTHPYTCQLLHVGSLLGAYVSMHFKRLYQRKRPSKRAPGLMPPIPVPGHPAYPSGHSTQAHLMALCVIHALPEENLAASTPVIEVRAHLRPVLLALAARIARNREIAGLHYESDSAAGARLAEDTLRILMSDSLAATEPAAIPPATPSSPRKPRFAAIVEKAMLEWT